MADPMRLYRPDELGLDGYPSEWHTMIKHVVREQAGHRCVRCGHPYGNGEHGSGEWSPCDDLCDHGGPFRLRAVGDEAWTEYDGGAEAQTLRGGDHPLELEARWRILTTHHLDGNKANCRWWNLAALDQRCHLQIQGKVQMARVWPWEHSDWFRPFVAGYYASVYLNEDLSREQVEARLDELLALERAPGVSLCR